MIRKSPIATWCRKALYMLGVGAAGALVTSSNVFAAEFARNTTPVTLPDMVYDADLQVMVDPDTRQQLYSRAEMLSVPNDVNKKTDSQKSTTKKKKPKALPTVTSGCPTCPKCDDHCG